MSKNDEQSMFIIAYEGRDTANQVYDVLRGLEKEDKIDIKTAVTVYRKENGKLILKHRRRLTVWKGAFGSTAIGLLLAGTGAGLLGGAVIGALIGSSRHGDRKETKEFLEDKLRPQDSALAILVSDVDWEAVQGAVEQFGGEEISVRLTPETQTQLAAIAGDPQVEEALAESVEIEEVVDKVDAA